MQEEINKKSRRPNILEQFIIGRWVRNMRKMYINLFVFLTASNIALWYFIFVVFGESWLMGIMILIFALVVGLLLLSVYTIIIETGIARPYQITSSQGNWTIELEGSSVRTRYPVSKVNGKAIIMATPEMAVVPKYGETRNIEYEYVEILDYPPPFGYNNLFVSIEGKGVTDKHKEFIEQFKPIGIFSIVFSIIFFVTLIFCFVARFDFIWVT